MVQKNLNKNKRHLTQTEKKAIREAATRGVLSRKVFLKVSQNSQVNTCARVSF